MGHFLTFEGIDGSGKSTQIERLAADLRRRGRQVVTTREPGGTPLGERLRALLLTPTAAPAAPETELALMAASRAQSVAELILPALAAGAWVLCDRFHDATEAYQGGGRGLDRGAIRELHRLLAHNLQPRLTLILDLDVPTALARARQRTAAGDTFERLGPGFFYRVAEAYRGIAAREPQRCRLIPAGGSPSEVASRIDAAVAPLLAAS